MGILEDTAATKKIADTFRPYVGMLLFIAGNGADPSSVTNNGTASFVDTGSAKLLVTCAHVIKAFRAKKAIDPSLTLAVAGVSGKGNVLAIHEDSVIDCGDDRLDLATLRLQKPEELQSIGKAYFPAGPWPPAMPRVDEQAAIVGYPGEQRRVISAGLQTNLTTVCVRVSSVSDRCFTLADENTDRLVVKLNPDLGDLRTLAGMSGSAAYAFDTDGTARLVGFLNEAGEQGGGSVSIRVVHASFINPDGTLNRNVVAW